MSLIKFKLYNILIFGIIAFILSEVLYTHSQEINVQNKIFIEGTLILSIFSFYYIIRHSKIYIDIIDVVVLCLFLYLLRAESNTIYFIHIKFLFAFYFILRCINPFIKHLYTYVYLFVITLCLIQVFIGLLQLFQIIDSNHTYFTITGTFFNPGPYGCYLAIIGSLTFIFCVKYFHYMKYLFLHKQQLSFYYKHKLFSLIYYLSIFIFILCSFLIVIIQNRTAILSLIITSAIFLIRNFHIIQRFQTFTNIKKLLYIILLLIFCSGFSYIMYLSKYQSTNSRIYIWNITLSIIKDKPLLGSGLNTFQAKYAQYQELYLKNIKHNNKIKLANTPDYVFNEYLYILCEFGIIGLFLIMWVIYFVLRTNLLQNTLSSYGIISILISALTSYPLHILSLQILLLLFIAYRRNHLHSQYMSKPIFAIFFILLVGFAFTDYSVYLKKIDITQKWITDKENTYSSVFEIRDLNDYANYYKYINDNPRFLLDYGEVLKNNNKYLESISILQEGCNISNDPIFYNLIGTNYKALNLYKLAEQAYLKAFQIQPNRITPIYLLALLYYDTHNFELFDKYVNKVINFIPTVNSEAVDWMKKDASELKSIMK